MQTIHLYPKYFYLWFRLNEIDDNTITMIKLSSKSNWNGIEKRDGKNFKALRCKEWLIFSTNVEHVVASMVEANSRGDPRRNRRRKFDESDSMFESRLGPRCLASNQNGRRSANEHQSQRDSYSISLRVFRFSAVAAINRATRNFAQGVTFAKLSRSVDWWNAGPLFNSLESSIIGWNRDRSRVAAFKKWIRLRNFKY